MTRWNELAAGLPGAHLLQTIEWGRVKRQNGWQPRYFVWVQESSDHVRVQQVHPDTDPEISIPQAQVVGAAQVLIRTARPFPASIAYCPKGPLLDWENIPLRTQVLADLEKIARDAGAFFIKIDPDVELGTGIPGSAESLENTTGKSAIETLTTAGWQISENQIQFANTVVLDLTQPEEDLLAGFKQKTRYNIRLADRRGVEVRLGDKKDLGRIYQLYAETAVRDGFTIRGEAYYQRAWGDFLRHEVEEHADSTVPGALPLIAEVEGEMVAAVIVYQFAGSAWFMFGMSGSAHRKKMPNYRLQWEAIERLKELDCRRYDLWGAPDDFSETDPLWGVYKFKEGFRGTVVRHIGAWDQPVRPRLFGFYQNVMPQILKAMRFRGNRTTQDSIR